MKPKAGLKAFLKEFALVRKLWSILKRLRTITVPVAASRLGYAKILNEYSFSKLHNVADTAPYKTMMNPLHKNESFSAYELIVRSNAHDVLCDETADYEQRVRSLLICMLYYKPYDLPDKLLLSFVATLEQRFLNPAYSFLYNVYHSYVDVGEADRHATFIKEALVWLHNDIKASNDDTAQQKIQLFSQTFSGSILISNSVNIKDTHTSLRSLLRVHLGYLYPQITEMDTFPKNESARKIKLGLIRYNYLGEIHYFQPILRYLDKSKYDIHILVFDQAGLAEINEAYPSLTHHTLSATNLESAVNDIRALNFDMVMNTASLSGDFYNPIASTLLYRVAPIQLTCCGDVTTSGIANVDYFIMGKNYLDLNLQDELVEKVIPCEGIGYYMPKPLSKKSTRSEMRSRLGLKESDVVYVSNAHVLKLNPELIELWVEILKATPHTKLLLMPFNSENTKKLFEANFLMMLQSICSDQSVDINRIVLSEARGGPEVLSSLEAGDIYLDSFPYSGPTSSTEALSLGLPVITLKGKSYRSCLTAGILQELSLLELITCSKNDYKKIAIKIANSADLRNNISIKLLEAMKSPSFFDSEKIAQQYDYMFNSIINPPLSPIA